MTILVTAGVHGNEPSGMEALPHLAARGFATLGPCNPWGYQTRSRYTRLALDLNRAFAREDCEEAEAVREVMRWARPNVVLDLHEDRNAAAPFLIQCGPASDLGPRIVEHLAGAYDFMDEPRLMLIRGANGVVRPSAAQAHALNANRGWSLDYWAWKELGCVAVCVEAPGQWDMPRKIALHVAVCEAAAALSG